MARWTFWLGNLQCYCYCSLNGPTYFTFCTKHRTSGDDWFVTCYAIRNRTLGDDRLVNQSGSHWRLCEHSRRCHRAFVERFARTPATRTHSHHAGFFILFKSNSAVSVCEKLKFGHAYFRVFYVYFLLSIVVFVFLQACLFLFVCLFGVCLLLFYFIFFPTVWW